MQVCVIAVCDTKDIEMYLVECTLPGVMNMEFHLKSELPPLPNFKKVMNVGFYIYSSFYFTTDLTIWVIYLIFV